MRVLVAEDDEPTRSVLAEAVGALGHKCSLAVDGVEALDALRRGGYELLIADIKMPRMDGMELLRQARAADPTLSVIIITGHGNVELAVEAMRHGASDFVTKPFDLEALGVKIQHTERERALAKENVDLKRELRGRYSVEAKPIVFVSRPMAEVHQQIMSVSRSPATVLITGESGTGKDLVARAIHYSGPRATAPFVALNCSSISKSLLESQLFGHVKGSFTGAVSDSRGFFLAAESGTLFLDEITEIDTGTQAKLLRSLQEKQVTPVGSTEPRSIDVRIIAATNRELEEALADGSLREDLYYRLNVVSIHLPPLRERPDDIEVLARHFVGKFSAEYSLSDREITPKALELLEAHQWPGNVRELENVIERAFALGEGPTITPDDLPPEISGKGRPRPSTGRFQPVPPRTLAEAEKDLVERTLILTSGNKSAAAQRLGIDRKRLYRLMDRHGLDS